MVAEADIWVQRGVVKTEQQMVESAEEDEWNAECAHRVPHADDFDQHVLALIIFAELSGDRIVVAAVDVEGMAREGSVQSLPSRHAAFGQHSPDAAGGVGASAEPK